MSSIIATLSAQQIDYLEKSLFLLQGYELENVLHPSQFELDFLAEEEEIQEATQSAYENIIMSSIQRWIDYLIRNNNAE